MCIYLIEWVANYTKSVSDKIMGVICCVTTSTGIVLLGCKKYQLSLIDDNLTWLEAGMPVIVGTGGCILYNLICYGIKGVWKRQPPKNSIELV